MKLIIRWLATSLALFAAAYFVPGIHADSPEAWKIFAVMAIILGLVNAIIRPFLKLLSCPLIILTLGLFTIIINAVSFMIASRIAESWFHVAFYVDDFWAALLGSLIVSAVSIVVNTFLKDGKATA
ncbi:MAG: phage holin family protein [Chloroflexi bacterium]|jgi:putative membrane protein|nr:phage holin family protein [Chloroflexota bacterium]